MTASSASPATELVATILVVEDDEVQLRMYEHVLTRPEWRLIVATTLADATRALEQNAVTLVLLDLFLPDGDGRTWLATLRSKPQYTNTRVVVVAGSTVLKAQVDCYQLGADTMLAKPIQPEVLLAVVRGALQRAGRRRSNYGPAGGTTPPGSGSRRSGVSTRPILLAEDDDVVAALVEHRLTREGFILRRATDGVAALRLARTTPPSLAILDVIMPGLDGFELLGQLRQLPEFERVPIVMLTGLSGERDVERALSMGANDYVLKQFSPVELTARVRRLLRH